MPWAAEFLAGGAVAVVPDTNEAVCVRVAGNKLQLPGRQSGTQRRLGAAGAALVDQNHVAVGGENFAFAPGDLCSP